MKTSWFRAFLFSLLVFFVISFLFWIIGYAIADLIDLEVSRIQSNPTHAILKLIYPIGMFPWEAIGRSVDMTDIGLKIYYIGFVVTLALSSIVAGLFGGSIVKALAGWYLTSIICILLFIIIFVVDISNLNYYCFSCTMIDGIIRILIVGLANMLMFGVLTFLIALFKGRSSK